jgi:hypothetical protein
MKRALTAGAVLLLALSLSACLGEDEGVKASPVEPSEVATETSADASAPATVEPTPTAPTPTEATVPTEAAGGTFDACEVVTAELISTDFGADAGQSLSQASSLSDPDAGDCIYFGGDATIVVQATTRADQDLPESSYSYEGLPGAEAVPGADRGWAYVFPNQSGDTVTSGLILVKGQLGLQCSITIDGHPYDSDTLQAFAQDVLANMG